MGDKAAPQSLGHNSMVATIFLIVPRNHVVTVSEPWDKFDNVPLVSGSKGTQGGDNGPSP